MIFRRTDQFVVGLLHAIMALVTEERECEAARYRRMSEGLDPDPRDLYAVEARMSMDESYTPSWKATERTFNPEGKK